MRLSELFTRTSKTVPADEPSRNAQLLIQAGFVYKEMAGAYAYLPLGLMVIENIKRIVREEMAAVHSNELIMTGLQRKDLWESTGRWSDEVVDVWFKSKLQDGTEIGFGWTHEEPIVEMLKQFVSSYKDLPISLYQFQTKLRNELRAKSGIMRGREFVMKDMYSLHTSNDELTDYYNQVIEAYKRVYVRLGLGDDTYVTFASGGAFTKFSHEFQTICDAGEDVIYLHRAKNLAVNEEVIDDAIEELGIKKEELEKVKTAEVGNIFNFGSSKTDEMGLKFTGEDGKLGSIFMGSYGIGITRVMGVIVEKFADERGLVWPAAVAPFLVYLAPLGTDDAVRAEADKLYDDLTRAGIAVLYDDRDTRPGEKFADADLYGIPYRVVISSKTIEQKKLELKHRTGNDVQLIDPDELITIIQS